MSATSNVILLGRNGIVREGLRRILNDSGFHVSQSAGLPSGLRSSDSASCQNASLLLIDSGSGEYNASVYRELQQRFPNHKLVVLADQFEFDPLVEAIRSGADGYLVKDMSCERLIASLQLVALGEKVLPSQLADELVLQTPDYVRQNSVRSLEHARLSSREINVLACLTMGYPNKVISRQLGISEATVKVHVKAVLRKLEVKNRTQAAIWAANNEVRMPVVEPVPASAPRSPAPIGSLAPVAMASAH